ncbi:hypothetical protein SLE2022_102340 [Rubroshorea leprosula]
MRKRLISFFLLSIFFLLHCSSTIAQTPVPAPAGPDNITAILEKGGQFTSFIRLLKSTQNADQINAQLNNSNQGLTIFAPTDNAFNNLKPGTLNSLSDQQKVQLVQYHILPTMLSMPQFQTVTNPLRTQAGDTGSGEFPLNITSYGNQVNISTGVVDATVANTMYTDSKLAVYQVDQVLLPLQLFGSSQAPAPAPSTPEKGSTPKASPGGGTADANTSSGMKLDSHGLPMVSVGFAVLLAISLQL